MKTGTFFMILWILVLKMSLQNLRFLLRSFSILSKDDIMFSIVFNFPLSLIRPFSIFESKALKLEYSRFQSLGGQPVVFLFFAIASSKYLKKYSFENPVKFYQNYFSYYDLAQSLIDREYSLFWLDKSDDSESWINSSLNSKELALF